jgi:hypothetical protein
MPFLSPTTARLQFHALADNLGNFMRMLAMPRRRSRGR